MKKAPLKTDLKIIYLFTYKWFSCEDFYSFCHKNYPNMIIISEK